MSDKKSVFQTLNATNVSEHMEKKGSFSYLSWVYAVQSLRNVCPTATWEVIKSEGKPFTATEFGVFVEVAVTVEGITLSQIHPVLDHKNKPIACPNAFHINTSIQRCLVKAIALHGLGLYIYAGEDLPEEEVKEMARKHEEMARDNEIILGNIHACESVEALKVLYEDLKKRGLTAQFNQVVSDRKQALLSSKAKEAQAA